PRAHFVHWLAALPAIAMLVIGAHEAVGSNHYGAADRLAEPVELLRSVRDAPFESALGPGLTTVLLLPAAGVGLASRARFLAGSPVAYATLALGGAALHVVGPATWRAYPDIYLKHFPQLVVVAPLFGIGMAVAARYVQSHAPRGARLVVPIAAGLLVATAWMAPEAPRLLFAERVMEREVALLEEAFEVLPPHDRLYVAGILNPPEGVRFAGDPLHAHFPTVLYRAALERRGLEPAVPEPLERLEAEVPRGRALLYVGSTLRTFYADEIRRGLVPASLERPELERVRRRYELEPVYVFTVRTDEPASTGNLVAAGRRDRIELGFYWLRPR
ncbi:MAG TPA: hypothetical protein VIL20_18155, partial [Sandaracinaceae bacterium]